MPVARGSVTLSRAMTLLARCKRLLFALCTGYLVLVAMLWALQGCMIHIPSKQLVATPADAGMDYEDLEIVTDDGERLHAWYIPASDPRGVLLFFHGNAGNISHRLVSIEQFRQLGLDVLIVDYRGYGRSSGRPSEQGLYRDASATYHWLREEKTVAPEHIAVFGRSLGAAVAANLASREPVGALILESGFTSIPDIGADLYPFLPVRLLTRYRYDTRAALAAVQVPVLVIHSPDDEIIPFRHGQALYQAAPEPKRLLEIRGDHNSGFYTSGNLYLDGLAQFLDEHLAH